MQVFFAEYFSENKIYGKLTAENDVMPARPAVKWSVHNAVGSFVHGMLHGSGGTSGHDPYFGTLRQHHDNRGAGDHPDAHRCNKGFHFHAIYTPFDIIISDADRETRGKWREKWAF
jgi:hypothetical protein